MTEIVFLIVLALAVTAWIAGVIALLIVSLGETDGSRRPSKLGRKWSRKSA